MHNQLIKIASTIILLFILGHGYAQNNSSSSPYSRYGIGELSTSSTGGNSGIANIGLGIRNPLQVNAANPASYSVIDTTTFLFEFGVNSKFTNFKADEGTMTRNDFNFSYLNLGFPVTKKWGMALGIKPFSNRGYNIINDLDDPLISYQGEGTFSKAYLGNSVEIYDGLSIGVNTYFLFGKTKHIGTVNHADVNKYDTFEEKTLEIHDFGLQFGAQYTYLTEKEHEITLGAVFSNETDHTSYSSSSLQRILSTQAGQINDTLRNNERTKGKITTPLSFGAGISYRIPDKLTVGFDYYHQNWADQEIKDYHQEWDGIQNDELGFKFQNLNRYSAGVEFIPRKHSISHYYERVNYRVGTFYENSYLNLRDQSINNFGITFGFGLPVKSGSSLINFSWEIGKRGTTKNSLVRETYSQFTLHFMLFDGGSLNVNLINNKYYENK